MNRAFSLVELSIVLVILGLLVGGILAGQSLIRASELRSVSADISKYETALHAFRDKYFALPGDMTNATAFWGKDATLCNSHTGTAATPGTCNGDGSGQWDVAGPEGYRAWQQLSLAGLVEGQYVGTITSYLTPTALGRDIPASKISSGGWTLLKLSQYSGTNAELGYSDLPDTRNNYLFLGATRPAYWSMGSIIKADEAWNIDTKLDDGRPAYGKLRAGSAAGCGDSNSSASQYRTNATDIRCSIGYILN